jgi:hemolysin activation/secretion protein
MALDGKLLPVGGLLGTIIGVSLAMMSSLSEAATLTPAGRAAEFRSESLMVPSREGLWWPDYPALPSTASALPAIPTSPGREALLSGQARILVQHIRLSGNTIFSEAELARITANYENREISAEELQALRRQLTLLYVERGYVNSGALIPDQQVKDGEITIRLIEGRLTGVTVSGNQRLRTAYISERLTRGLTTPLDMNELGANVLALHDGPVIRRVKARLQPGDTLGQAVLNAEIEEQPPWQLRFQFANDRSPSLGGERLEAKVAHHNLTGWGDTLEVQGGLTEGLHDLQTSYSRPLNAADTTVKVWFGDSEAEVVEAPFQTLDISSTTETYGLSLEHPLFKTTAKEWRGGGGLGHRRGETFLLDEPFSFSPGAQDGVVEVTVLRLSQDFSIRQHSRVLACRQLFSFGVDSLGTTAEGGPDENFLVSLSQAQWVERLGPHGVQILSKADLQLATEPLLYLEKIAMGGDSTVRGYRENLLSRDNGATASVELRWPIGRVPLVGLSREADDGTVQLAPFVDWGRSWDNNAPATATKNLASLGIGLRWDPSPKIHAQIYVAKALTSGSGHMDQDVQDAGLHFRLSYQPL